MLFVTFFFYLLIIKKFDCDDEIYNFVKYISFFLLKMFYCKKSLILAGKINLLEANLCFFIVI